jgi:mRNA-degrading endonuclease RelE of RelBE toxin-antitoxin system
MSGTNDTRTRAIVDLGLTILTARQQARDIDELWDRLSRAYAVIRRETEGTGGRSGQQGGAFATIAAARERGVEFRIADTFTDSLARLTGDEQKAVKTTAFDLQVNPANPGMSFHKLDKARDKNFWSVRVSNDIRLIVHRSDQSLLLCYVDHHDKAYDWAERRKLETHPKTGAAQLVEIRETVREIVVPVYVQTANPGAPKPSTESKPLFAEHSDASYSAMVCPPNGSKTSRRQPKIRCRSWRTTYLPRPPKRCLNSRPAASRACSGPPHPRRLPSSILTPFAASV